MATICVTMFGNTPVFRIEKLSCCPVETSSRILYTALVNTALPVDPATEFSASTRGTPAANVVERVRA